MKGLCTGYVRHTVVFCYVCVPNIYIYIFGARPVQSNCKFQTRTLAIQSYKNQIATGHRCYANLQLS